MNYELEGLKSDLKMLREELRAYKCWDSEMQKHLYQLKDEFRKFLEYSKIALSYETEPDNTEPTPQLKTILKFRPAND